MTIDERVTAFMEAREFALIPHGRFFKPGSVESRESDWLVVARDARFMYRLHLESMKEETQGTKEWTLLPIIARDLDSTALLVMRAAADKRIAKLDKLIAETKA